MKKVLEKEKKHRIFKKPVMVNGEYLCRYCRKPFKPNRAYTLSCKYCLEDMQDDFVEKKYNQHSFGGDKRFNNLDILNSEIF